MRRTLLTLAFCAIAAGGLIDPAHHDDEQRRSRCWLATKDIAEKVDGKKAKATTVEVTLAPGEAEASHRHPGPGFGYVLEGEYEWAIDDNPAKVLKAGDTFYEPTGCLHRVSRNPSKTGKTRILAVVLHPADVKDIVIPEKEKKE